MAESLVLDIDKGQQLSQRLAAVGRTIEGFQPLPQPSGPLGSGVLERAWSEFQRTCATAKQGIVQDVTGSSNGFGSLVSDLVKNDQDHAQQARELGAT